MVMILASSCLDPGVLSRRYVCCDLRADSWSESHGTDLWLDRNSVAEHTAVFQHDWPLVVALKSVSHVWALHGAAAPLKCCCSLAGSQDFFVLQRVKKDVDKGTQHSDMFLLKPEEAGEGTAVAWLCGLGVGCI